MRKSKDTKGQMNIFDFLSAENTDTELTDTENAAAEAEKKVQQVKRQSEGKNKAQKKETNPGKNANSEEEIEELPTREKAEKEEHISVSVGMKVRSKFNDKEYEVTEIISKNEIKLKSPDGASSIMLISDMVSCD